MPSKGLAHLNGQLSKLPPKPCTFAISAAFQVISRKETQSTIETLLNRGIFMESACHGFNINFFPLVTCERTLLPGHMKTAYMGGASEGAGGHSEWLYYNQ